MEMMLTGRVYDAEEGQAAGLSHYLVEQGAGLAKGIELAQRIATNSPLTNFGIMHVLPRIAEQDAASGYLMESLMAAIAQGDEEAKLRLRRLSREARRQVVQLSGANARPCRSAEMPCRDCKSRCGRCVSVPTTA